jgi:hypothetical protein
MIPLGRFSEKQEKILRHLVKRGHAMTSRMLCDELPVKYIGVDTFAALMARGYIVMTSQGYLATEAGRLRVSDVV